MIEGADRFTYLGLVRHGEGVMLVFKQGALILDLARAGWGIMPPGALRRLVPGAPLSPLGSDDDDGGNGDDSDSLATPLSTSDDDEDLGLLVRGRSADASPQRSRSPTPDPAPGAPARPAWHPPADLLGWHVSDTAVAVIPLTQDTQTRLLLAEGAERRALMADLLAGRVTAPSDAHPGVAVLVCMTAFGEPRWQHWVGRWSPARNEAHRDAGLTDTLACALVAHASVCEQDRLAAVVYPPDLAYEGLVQGDGVSALAFDTGLLVTDHPDPDMRGWHDLRGDGRWDLVTAGAAHQLDTVAASPYIEEFALTRSFLDGTLWSDQPGTDFYALIRSNERRQWYTIHVAPPMAWIPVNDPHGPGRDEVQQALAQAAIAPLHDWQRLDDRDPLALCAGRWNLPWLLGALRLLTFTHAAPELLKTCWHDTLQPALQSVLLAHRAQEKAWLAAGLIRQPVDGLIALAQRDLRLRRPEVRLSWPATAVDDLFKTLAPHARVQVVPHPAAAAVDPALAGDKPVLLLFQSATSPAQDAVLVLRGRQVGNDHTQRPVNQLKTRIASALAPQGEERLVALVFAG